MKWDKLIYQALDKAGDAMQSPISDKVRSTVQRGLISAATLSQNLPSQEQISQALEEKSPLMAQAFLSYASELSNPYQLGMGMKILELGDETARVQMPHRWRNRSSNGAFHSGALVTLAEFTAKSFWDRHLGDELAKMELQDLQCRFFKNSFRGVTAQLNLAGEERERLLFELRKTGETQMESTVNIFSKNQLRVAEITLVWRAISRFAVSGRVNNQ